MSDKFEYTREYMRCLLRLRAVIDGPSVWSYRILVGMQRAEWFHK